MTTRFIQEIADRWSRAEYPVVFTGAGMSTESGLPDFRSAKGMWKSRPESLATMTALYNQPDEFYFFYQWRINTLWGVRPNTGHCKLAAAEEQGYLKGIITQNVDGLHQRAGSKNVIELHGTLRTVSCLDCRTAYDSRRMLPVNNLWLDDYHNGSYHYGDECKCQACGGHLRPDVVLFGEALPEKGWQIAAKLSQEADFFIVIGSALAVSPANLCPEMAQRNGAGLLIINREPTPLDGKADWVIREAAGPTLKQIVDLIVKPHRR